MDRCGPWYAVTPALKPASLAVTSLPPRCPNFLKVDGICGGVIGKQLHFLDVSRQTRFPTQSLVSQKEAGS